jgi:hypothetical protein
MFITFVPLFVVLTLIWGGFVGLTWVALRSIVAP